MVKRNDTPLTNSQKQLCAKYFNMAKHLAGKPVNGMDFDERFSLATWACVKAARAYNPTKGAFSTLLYRCYFQQICAMKRTDKFYNWLQVEHDESETDTSKLDVAIKTDDRMDILREYIHLLDAGEYTIFMGRLSGRTFMDIAKDSDVSDETVRLIYNQSIKKLRKAIHGEG